MKKPSICFMMLISLVLSGCHSFEKDTDVERDWLGREIEVDYTIPSKIVAIWTNSVFDETGKGPVRGLGGRVYFYDGEHHPVRVNGKLSVFLYDDTSAGEKLEQQASRVVHFTPEEVKSNFTPSEFGASYSFWVPWDAVGGDRKQLSVIPVFTDTTGQMLVGEQARHLLPGTQPVTFEDESGDGVVQASHTSSSMGVNETNVASGNSDSSLRSSRSTTIKLPATMQERLKMQPPKNGRRSWDLRERTELSRELKSLSTRSANDVTASTPSQQFTPLENTAQPNSVATASLQQLSTDLRQNQPQAPASRTARRPVDRAPSILAPRESLFAR